MPRSAPWAWQAARAPIQSAATRDTWKQESLNCSQAGGHVSTVELKSISAFSFEKQTSKQIDKLSLCQ